jgi:hypothetical protein
MVSETEVFNLRYMEFIKVTNLLDYRQKYSLARSLLKLKKKPEVIEKIEKKKNELEKEFGHTLPALQTLLNASDDLNSFYPDPNSEDNKTIRFLDMKLALDNFKDYLFDVIDENCIGGWGV